MRYSWRNRTRITCREK